LKSYANLVSSAGCRPVIEKGVNAVIITNIWENTHAQLEERNTSAAEGSILQLIADSGNGKEADGIDFKIKSKIGAEE
jgi:hypothetical protein